MNGCPMAVHQEVVNPPSIDAALAGPRSHHSQRVTIMPIARLSQLCALLIWGVCYTSIASAQEPTWAEKMFDQKNIDF